MPDSAPDAPHDPPHDPSDVVANGHRPKDSVLDAVPLAETQELEKYLQPRYSTRGTAPGHRGCWALNRDGDPCGAARRADSDYCNAHSGYGVASDPKKWAAVGSARNNELRRRRSSLRATLGITRTNTPRGVLKAMVFAESERVAAAALDGALAAELPADRRSAAALKLIDAVDPLAAVTATVSSLPSTPEGVASLSLSQMLSLAEQHGIDLAALEEG